MFRNNYKPSIRQKNYGSHEGSQKTEEERAG